MQSIRRIIIISCITALIVELAYSQRVSTFEVPIEYKDLIYKGRKEKNWFQRFFNISNQEPFAGSYAIVIAISNYEFLPPLKSVERDREKIKNFLLETGEYDEIVILKNDEADFETIRYFMQTYFPTKMSKGKYRFLLFFTGHGTQFEGYDGNMIGYLQLKNATGQENDSNMIDMTQVENWANKFRNASHLLFLLDCCFSGLAGAEVKNYDPSVDLMELTKENGRFMITAEAENETSVADLKRWGGSLFTDVAIHGMKGEADSNRDGVVVTYELFNYIQVIVAKEARKIGYSQHPLLSKLGSSRDKGQYIFVYRNPETSSQQEEMIAEIENKGSTEQELFTEYSTAQASQNSLPQVVYDCSPELPMIHFEFSSYALTPEAIVTLQQVGRLMRLCQNLVIEVQGHTDWMGTEETNMRHSARMAKAVVYYLVYDEGIDPARLVRPQKLEMGIIEGEAYGESLPIASNETEEGRAVNRRVQFVKLEDRKVDGGIVSNEGGIPLRDPGATPRPYPSDYSEVVQRK